MRNVGTIDRVASWIVGGALLALGIYVIAHGVKLFDLRRDVPSRVTLTPLPPWIRSIGGVTAFALGIPITLFGARLIIRPAKLNEKVARGSL